MLLPRPSFYAASLLLLFVATCHATEFASEKEVGDQDHIKQHLENKIDVDKLSEEQKRFHYFSMHDLNKDERIDGIEILKALTHSHDEAGPTLHNQSDDELVTMIDAVLADLDTDGDGYIDYSEYSARHKA